MNQSILIIDPEPSMQEALSDAFRLHGYQTEEVGEIAGAQRLLRQRGFDGILCDPRFPSDEGFDFLSGAREYNPNLIILLMLSQRWARNAIRAVQLGADDYVLKPFSIDEVLSKFRRALEIRSLQSEVLELREQLRDRQTPVDIIGSNKTMREIVRMVQLVARTTSAVLITGEAGTGKELIARTIHQLSDRPNSLMQTVNCETAPESLLEDLLWGHVKDAFPDAAQDRPGSLALADKGTLFLDDISGLPLPLQAKLLRIIQDREISPLGSEKSYPLDVRIIAASKIDLRHLVLKELFREDLFYRLNVIPIHLPPLRNRREDIPALAAHFISRITSRLNLPAKSLSPAARRWLLGYDWPGNVGQLEAALQAACALSGNRTMLQPEDFHPVANPASLDIYGAPELEIPAGGIDLNKVLESMERRMKAVLENTERKLVEKSLAITGGNRNQAARLLSLKRTTLIEKLRKWEEC